MVCRTTSTIVKKAVSCRWIWWNFGWKKVQIHTQNNLNQIGCQKTWCCACVPLSLFALKHRAKSTGTSHWYDFTDL